MQETWVPSLVWEGPSSRGPTTPTIQLSSVQSLSCVQLFEAPWTAAHQASLSITNSQSLFKLVSIESMMPSNHLILCRPLQSCPASGSFPVSQFFASGGQRIGASASTSVLPMNIQDWLPLGLTDLISLQSEGLSRVFSNTTVQKYQFVHVQLSLWSHFHIHTWLLEKPQLWLYGPFIGKVMSLFFNMLPRLVIAFLPRSKHLLISWLQL